MPFSREKDLWRYASKNLPPPANGTSSQPQQLLLHQHRHHLQRQGSRHHYPLQQQHQVYAQQLQTLSSDSCYHNSLMGTHPPICDQAVSNTPPPPYSPVFYEMRQNDYLLDVQQPQQNFTVLTADTEQTCETPMRALNSSGCKRGSSGDDIFVGSCGPARGKGKNTSRMESPLKYSQRLTRYTSGSSTSPDSQATTAVNTITTKLASMANIIRNLCGTASFTDSNTVTATTATTMTISDQKNGTEISRNYFRKLMEMMKREQKNQMLEAVKSRIDSGGAIPKSCCILLPRTLIYGELPYVVTCRLFFWSDLRDVSELKPLPICPCERDPIYVCCNPLHWCRIIETETAPPPYQGIGMERLKGKGTGSEITGSTITASTTTASTNSGASIRRTKMNDIYVNFPKSLTTQSEERQSWCQVAYWELGERVGSQCFVQKPAVSIYAEGSCCNEYADDMCLKDLAAKRVTAPPAGVEHTRQKIGLGIILSQEEDGVWLFNRCASPIFVLSPTLNDNWSPPCVYRISPGSCLKAFDNQRALSIMYSAQSSGAEVGPINTHSMCISFVKGWGENFKRQTIMTCPCWVEVLFTQR